jgi:hypothetical protein
MPSPLKALDTLFVRERIVLRTNPRAQILIPNAIRIHYQATDLGFT